MSARISSFNQYTCSRLADRSWKGHSFAPSRQLNLVAGYKKKKKKRHKLYIEGCGGGGRRKCNELMFPLGICLLTQRKRWLFSKIFLLLCYQLPLGRAYKSGDCQQNKTRFLLIVVNVQAPWNNRDFAISPAKATLGLLFPARASGHVQPGPVEDYANSKFWS